MKTYKLTDEMKRAHMTELAEYRKQLFQKPILKFLFLELTLNCNERCIHCGSSCGEASTEGYLSTQEYFAFLDQIKEDFGTQGYMLCITGGEPLLRPDFFEIMGYAHSLGFSWGMTSNATLITKEVAHKLKEVGMKTISVSIDGLEETHDKFRRTPGGYRKALEGIQNLLDENCFKAVQVTTVVTHENISQLDELFSELDAYDLDSWRVINLEPIGRAKQYPELLLTPEDYRKMFTFIREKRREGYPLTYGCSHYLGTEWEREVRQWYFLCNAGIYTASIMANGDIAACLDIERRQELIQGNIRLDRFKDVWENKFEAFRTFDYRTCEKCEKCSELTFCGGGAFHSWNFDDNRPEICFKDILF